MQKIDEAQMREMMEKGDTFLLDFWAPWCGYCRRLEPALKELETEYAGKVLFGSVNIEEEHTLSREARITVIPTLKFYSGGREIETLTGPESKAEIDAFLRKALGGHGDGARL